MRVSCPSCNAEMSLELLLGREADARAVAALLERELPLGELMLRYVALFRPPKRRLGLARMVALVNELLPDVERGAIARKGRDWAAPREAWKTAMETVLAKRDKGTLVLPLTSHGLLLEVLCGLAEKGEARAETEREKARRQARPAGAEHGPRDGATVLRSVAAALGGGAPALAADYTRPSRAAQEIKARIEAGRRRASAPAGDADAPPPDAATPGAAP